MSKTQKYIQALKSEDTCYSQKLQFNSNITGCLHLLLLNEQDLLTWRTPAILHLLPPPGRVDPTKPNFWAPSSNQSFTTTLPPQPPNSNSAVGRRAHNLVKTEGNYVHCSPLIPKPSQVFTEVNLLGQAGFIRAKSTLTVPSHLLLLHIPRNTFPVLILPRQWQKLFLAVDIQVSTWALIFLTPSLRARAVFINSSFVASPSFHPYDALRF